MDGAVCAFFAVCELVYMLVEADVRSCVRQLVLKWWCRDVGLRFGEVVFPQGVLALHIQE